MFSTSAVPVTPLNVSILMTVLNGERYVAEAIDSVVAQQTQAHWELVIVDDGSTDRSTVVLQEYAERFPKQVRWFRHAGGVNRGISASRNLALQHARAPIVAFLDCDDVLLPNHLATQLSVLSRHPEVAMTYSSAERWVEHELPFDEAASNQAWWGRNYTPPLVPKGQACGLLEPGMLLRWMLTDESFAPCMCTVVVRTAAARAVRGFENQFKGLYDDQVFHAKLSSRFKVYANDVCTARYRKHDQSCCAKASVRPALRHEQSSRFDAWLEQFHRPATEAQQTSA